MKKSELFLFLCVFCFGFFAFYGVEYFVYQELLGGAPQNNRNFQMSFPSYSASPAGASRCEIELPELITVENGLTQGVLKQVFHTNKPSLKECFHARSDSKLQKSLSSGVNIRLYIHPDGRVLGSQIMDGDSINTPIHGDKVSQQFSQCISSHIRTWKYPKAKNGNFSSVIYYAVADEKIMVDF